MRTVIISLSFSTTYHFLLWSPYVALNISLQKYLKGTLNQCHEAEASISPFHHKSKITVPQINKMRSEKRRQLLATVCPKGVLKLRSKFKTDFRMGAAEVLYHPGPQRSPCKMLWVNQACKLPISTLWWRLKMIDMSQLTCQ